MDFHNMTFKTAPAKMCTMNFTLRKIEKNPFLEAKCDRFALYDY